MQTAAGQRGQGFPREAPGRVVGGHWAIFDSASWQAVRRSNWCSSDWSCIMLPVVVADGPGFAAEQLGGGHPAAAPTGARRNQRAGSVTACSVFRPIRSANRRGPIGSAQPSIMPASMSAAIACARRDPRRGDARIPASGRAGNPARGAGLPFHPSCECWCY